MAPLRVVSVLPSATEMLCFIGGGHLLVGRSHEDNYPESITHLPIVTGQLTEFTTARDVDMQVSSALSSGQSLYTIDEQLLNSLKPDVYALAYRLQPLQKVRHHGGDSSSLIRRGAALPG